MRRFFRVGRALLVVQRAHAEGAMRHHHHLRTAVAVGHGVAEHLAGTEHAVVGRQVDALALQLAKARAARVATDRVITQEVTRYVEVTAPSDRCTLPGTWRVRHDLAATGGDPAAAGGLAGGAEPVTDAAALDTVAANYLGCRDAIDQVKGWQAWWERVKP
mgnify:CR=1 FL=1